MEDKKDKSKDDSDPEPDNEPYVSPFHKLTKEQWELAMRKGLEDSDSQAASIREMIESGGRKKN